MRTLHTLAAAALAVACVAGQGAVKPQTNLLKNGDFMLLRAHGDYWVRESSGETVDPWIEFSFPFPFETQTPLALKVTTDPPDRVASLEIIPDAENRHLRVHLKPAGRGPKCTVRYEALVAVRDRPRGKGEKAVFAERAKLPSEVAWYFEKTPGIDPDDPGIQAVAKTFKTDTLEHAVDGALTWLRANMKPISGGDQGGKATFERKGAPCTGHANLAASLFQAAGLPCRVLGCLMGPRLQEHYIVQLWTPGEGWRRVEATTKAFPIPDSLHLILHVAHPSFFRSEINVPLHCRTADGCRGEWRYGKDQAWQGMAPVGSLPFGKNETAALETAARDAFKAWEKKPAAGAEVMLLAPDAVKKLAPTATTLVEILQDFQK